jgi:hypothetical protein
MAKPRPADSAAVSVLVLIAGCVLEVIEMSPLPAVTAEPSMNACTFSVITFSDSDSPTATLTRPPASEAATT